MKFNVKTIKLWIQSNNTPIENYTHRHVKTQIKQKCYRIVKSDNNNFRSREPSCCFWLHSYKIRTFTRLVRKTVR